MAEGIVTFLLEKLNGLIVSEVLLLTGVGQKIEDIRDELASMQAFLKDADRRKDTDEGLNEWVRQVRDTACNLEDIIDEFMLRFGRQPEHGCKGFMKNVFIDIKHFQTRRNLANNIKSICERIRNISERRSNYRFDKADEATSSSSIVARQHDGQQAREVPFTIEVDIMGFDKEIEILIKQLTEEKKGDALGSILVAGMGGSGKTTLVRKVYNDTRVKKHFDYFAWVPVSQSFHPVDLLRYLSKGLFEERKMIKIDETHAQESGEKVFNHLKDKRYLIVLDDVWDRKAWHAINFALPKNSKGSMIMITTRNQDISFMLEADGLTCFLHKLDPLPDEIAMELFCKKAFKWTKYHKACPPELTQLCNKLVAKCEGLPLAIVSLGSLMSTKQQTQLAWNKTSDDLRYQLSNNPSLSRVRNILTLSYKELPLYLRPCFLYCSVFPEDYEIHKARLINLWIAEGLVKERPHLSAEEVGEEWLQELINRNMLQVVEPYQYGGIRKCSLHDLVRELAINQGEIENFSTIFESTASNHGIRSRHLSILSKRVEALPCMVNSQFLHSLFLFVDTITQPCLKRMLKSLKLVRVLDLQGAKIPELPSTVGELLHLRYLNLRETMIRRLPKSFYKLVNLQVLDIRGTPITALSKGIRKMRNLRHLCMTDMYQVQMSKQLVSSAFGNLSCLQTLTGIAGNKQETIKDLANLISLKKLAIYEVGEDSMDELSASIRRMNNLHTLFIHSLETLELGKLFSTAWPQLRCLRLYGQLERMPSVHISLSNLLLLVLVKSRLRDDPFPKLWSLPNLKTLILWPGSYEGHQLQCEAKGFPKLVSLFLSKLESLEEVILEEGCMPNLKTLGIHDCVNLERVPQGIHLLRNLEELDITEMPPEFLRRLKKDGGEDRALVEHVPKLVLMLYDAKEGYKRMRSF